MSALPPSSSRLRHRIAAAATTLTLAGGLVAAGAASAQALPWRPGTGESSTDAASTGTSGHSASSASASPRFVWARTVTGREVKVAKPTFAPTPIHPEKITHPGRDFAGSTVAAHFHGPAVRPPKAGPNTVPALPGIDVSAYQGNITWSHVCPYIDFAYAKATEGTYYTNPDFANQYNGPYSCKGVIRGAYHFAIPSNSSGQAQADYFIKHGGGWSGDGKTLPGALDIEYNPYGKNICYARHVSTMVTWIKNFVTEYAYKEHVYPVIYSTTNWWSTCTGNTSEFSKKDPLWIANYTDSHGGPLPHGWGFYTFWQYRSSGSLPGDQDVFNGAYSQLKAIAKG